MSNCGKSHPVERVEHCERDEESIDNPERPDAFSGRPEFHQVEPASTVEAAECDGSSTKCEATQNAKEECQITERIEDISGEREREQDAGPNRAKDKRRKEEGPRVEPGQQS